MESIPYSLRVLFSHALRKVLDRNFPVYGKVIDLYTVSARGEMVIIDR